MTPVSTNNLARWFVGLSLLLGSPFVGIAQTRGITFATGAGEVQLSVQPVADAIVEGEEFVTLELVDDPPNYVLAPQRAARMGLGDLTPPPDLLGFAPATGLPGTLVTLRGHSLDLTTVVTFNGVPAVFTVDSPYQVTVTVPPKAISGPIGLATPLGAITSTGTFTVLEDGKWSDEWVDRNWSDRQRSDYGFDLNSVTHADGLYVAVGEFGIIRTSPDGQKWTMQESGYLGDLYGVTAGKINGVNWFVAVGGGATREAGGVILKSMDGLNWELFKVDRPLFCVTFGNNSFLAGGLFRLFQSSDLTTWAKRETPRQDAWRETAVALAYGNGLFAMTTALAHHDGRGHRLVFTSTDGVKWERKMDRAGEWWYRYGAICFGPTTGFLAVGHHSNDFGPGSTGGYCSENDDCYNAVHFWEQDFGLSNNAGRWAHFSSDGISWTERSKPDEVGLFGLAYGDDTFVAVGNGGAIRLTLDGQFWQSFQAPTVERLRSVVYGGGQFLAVGRKWVVVASKTGVEWSLVRSAASPFGYWSRSILTGVTSGPRGMVAVGNGQTILLLTNGVGWSKPLIAEASEYLPGALTFSEAKVDASSKAGRIARAFPTGIASGDVGSAVGTISFVPGSFTWTEAFQDASRRGGLLWFWKNYGEYVLARSAAGGRNAWVNLRDEGHEGQWRGLGSDGKEFDWTPGYVPWGGGQPDNAGGREHYAHLMTNGALNDQPGENRIEGYILFTILSPSEKSGWLAGTDQGTEGTWRWDGTTNIISNIPWALQQPDGAAVENNLWWNGKAAEDRKATDKGGYFIEYPDNQLAGDFRSVASGAGRYVIVGSKTVLSSSDLKIWRRSTPEATNDFTKVRFLNGQFMALGVGGALWTSLDGISWASRTSGVSTALQDVAYGAGRYVAVGESGAIVGSVDGVAWEKVQTGFTAPLRAIAFGNGTFVAVGDGGVVLASETGTGWRLRSSSGKTFRLLEFAENRFIAGDGSALFQSADGRTWEPWSRHRDFTSIYDRKRTFNALWVGERSAWLVGEYATILQSSEYLPSLPAVSLQLGEGTASEVGPRAGTFILRRSGDISKPLTIRVRIGGTAVEPDDYVITGPILR